VIILAGIVKGTMTTTHSYTGDQVTVKNSVLC
jgi:glyceraldehyde-3-phosphate dehydrogenase/erythrose-4-phosphate dehydrogenase